jgi:hypothetical protein
MICHYDRINSLSCTGLSQAEIDRFVGCLFDKDPPNARPASMPTPFSSENSPPSVRLMSPLVFFVIVADESLLFALAGRLP